MHIYAVDVLLFMCFILDRTNFSFAFTLDFEMVVVFALIIYLFVGGSFFQIQAIQNLIVVVLGVLIGVLRGILLFEL